MRYYDLLAHDDFFLTAFATLKTMSRLTEAQQAQTQSQTLQRSWLSLLQELLGCEASLRVQTTESLAAALCPRCS